MIAGLILIVGFGRVFYGIKGAALYLDNPILWVKIVAFLVLGLLSVPPTMAVVAWRNRARRDQAFVPPVAEIEKIKTFMRLEASVFILIPIFARMGGNGN